MAKKTAKPKAPKSVETLTHDEAKRKNIPTAEHESVLGPEHHEVKKLRYPRNTDLDPQFVWRGKDEQDWSDLVVQAPPLYIQEKIHPKAIIEDLRRRTQERRGDAADVPDNDPRARRPPRGSAACTARRHLVATPPVDPAAHALELGAQWLDLVDLTAQVGVPLE